MIGTRLKQLIEQINFLVEIEQDSLNECVQELGSLLVFLEQQAAKTQDEEVFGGLDIIRKKLSEDYTKMCESYKDEIDYLKNQRSIIEQAMAVEKKSISDFEALELLIMEDVGDLESNDIFKERVTKTNQESRTDFLSVLEEIKESIEEGSIDDLANYFQALAIDEADEFYNEETETEIDGHKNNDIDDSAMDAKDIDEDEDDLDDLDDESSHDFDLFSNKKITEALKKFSEPYFVEDIGSANETKNNGSLIFDILIATMIAGLAISVAIKMPVMLVNFWKKIQITINKNFLRTRIIKLLDQDFSTAFIPEMYLKKIILKNNENKKDPSEQKKSSESDEKKEKKQNMFFALKEKNNNLDYCFFVSTNLIPTYSKPGLRIAGVFYVLKQMPDSIFEKNLSLRKLKGQPLFQLNRIETTKLSIHEDFSIDKISKNNDGLTLIKFIKKFRIELTALVPAEKEDESAKEEKKPDNKNSEKKPVPSFEIKTTSSWPLEKSLQFLLPRKVKIKCDYFDEQLDEQSIEIETIVFSSYVFELKKSKEDLEIESSNKEKNSNQEQNKDDKKEVDTKKPT